MHAAVTVLSGAGHVVTYQSHSAVLLLGLLIGMPIREALVSKDRAFVQIFKLLDDVYATGVSMRVEVAGGVMWLTRLVEESGFGVGLYYERSPDRAPLGPPRVHRQIVSVR